MFWIIGAIAVSTAVIVWQVHAACAYLNRELRGEEQGEGVVFMIPHPAHDERYEDEHKTVEDFHAYTH